LEKKPFIGTIMPVETNILIFDVKAPYSAAEFCKKLQLHRILCLAIAPTRVRMVTHLDITKEMVKNLVHVIEAL